jgi:hypothetical protein
MLLSGIPETATKDNSGVDNSSGRSAKAELLGLKNVEEMKDVMVGLVKGVKPQANEATAEPRNVNYEILMNSNRLEKR